MFSKFENLIKLLFCISIFIRLQSRSLTFCLRACSFVHLLVYYCLPFTCLFTIYLFVYHLPVCLLLTCVFIVDLFVYHWPVYLPFTCWLTVYLFCLQLTCFVYSWPVCLPLTCWPTIDLFIYCLPVCLPLPCLFTIDLFVYRCNLLTHAILIQ